MWGSFGAFGSFKRVESCEIIGRNRREEGEWQTDRKSYRYTERLADWDER